jgi:hypothetical protein
MRKNWKIARTKVFEIICNDITFCKENGKAMIFVDEPEIGKTVAARYMVESTANTFYIDCSQCRSRTNFLRELCALLNLNYSGTEHSMKMAVKKKLVTLDNPIVILDEAGDLDNDMFVELKEYWNATEGRCGWYMMGADGLRARIQRGIQYQRVGYRELFSRFNGRFMTSVPNGKADRREFYRELLTDVITANIDDKKVVPALVNKCLASDAEGEIAGLRRAETLILLQKQS